MRACRLTLSFPDFRPRILTSLSPPLPPKVMAYESYQAGGQSLGKKGSSSYPTYASNNDDARAALLGGVGDIERGADKLRDIQAQVSPSEKRVHKKNHRAGRWPRLATHGVASAVDAPAVFASARPSALSHGGHLAHEGATSCPGDAGLAGQHPKCLRESGVAAANPRKAVQRFALRGEEGSARENHGAWSAPCMWRRTAESALSGRLLGVA
jgi:hypothetical protein